MPIRSGRAAARRTKAPAQRLKKGRNAKDGVGALPEWDLSDLYPGLDSPEIANDLVRSDTQCLAFEEQYKGKLAALAGGPAGGAALAAAVRELESIDDLIGRIASFASLVYTGDTTDPVRAKFFGDVQERITTSSSHLLFFSLELNKIDDEVLEHAMADPALGHYRPWIEDIRKEKPHQLEDRIEQLFHEKSVTGQGAWNRLFDDTIAGLRFKIGAKTLPIEPTLNLLQDRNGQTRKAAAEALGRTLRQISAARGLAWIALTEHERFARATGATRLKLRGATGELVKEGRWPWS
jgi:oligoendopeptidase F